MSKVVATSAEATILRLTCYLFRHKRGKAEIEAEKRQKTKTQVAELSALRKEARTLHDKIVEKGQLNLLPRYKAILGQISQLSAELAEVRKPYNEEKKPLNAAIRFLEKEVPSRLEKAGYDVSPTRTVLPEVLSLIASAKKAKEARKAKKAQKKRAKKAK